MNTHLHHLPRCMRRTQSLIATAAFLAIATPVLAANQTWQGDVSSAWQTTGNWNGNALPGSGDTAFFDNTAVTAAVTHVGHHASGNA